MNEIIYAIGIFLIIVVMVAFIIIFTISDIKNQVNNDFKLYDNLKDKYPDIKADNFDPLFYLVLNHNMEYLESDNVVFYKSANNVTHCIHYNGDINNLIMYSPYIVIIHIIQNKKSVNFKVLSPILQKIEIINE